MIVTVIRHAKVDMKWDLMMTSAGYDKGCADYDTAGVLPVTVRLPETEFERIYVSALPRTTATARQVFADREFESTALINEVPERSGFDTGLKLPMFLWSAVSRIQWFFNVPRQPETRAQTRLRAKKAAQYLSQKNEDCAVFSHGFFMIFLLQEMEKQGFQVDHKRLHYSNGEAVICRK
jgi:broad specificity phosphatase PhoE